MIDKSQFEKFVHYIVNHSFKDSPTLLNPWATFVIDCQTLLEGLEECFPNMIEEADLTKWVDAAYDLKETKK